MKQKYLSPRILKDILRFPATEKVFLNSNSFKIFHILINNIVRFLQLKNSDLLKFNKFHTYSNKEPIFYTKKSYLRTFTDSVPDFLDSQQRMKILFKTLERLNFVIYRNSKSIFQKNIKLYSKL